MSATSGSEDQELIASDLTVAVCTFNGARFIEDQLRSILNQTLLPCEILVSDDGSTDGTLDRINAVFADRPHHAQPIRLVVLPARGAPLGPARNFEYALNRATTELIALSDQDDIWEPDRLARGTALLREHAETWLVASNTTLIDSTGAPLPGSSFSIFGVRDDELQGLRSQDVLPALVRRNFVQGMTFILRRDLLDFAGAAPPPFLHDYWLAICAAAVGRMRILEAPLVRYRLHGGNVVGGGERSAVLRTLKRAHWFITHPRSGTPRRLMEWNAVERRLGGAELPSREAELLARKVAFERERFRGTRSLSAHLEAVRRLRRSGAYEELDRDGNRAVLEDLLWRRSRGPTGSG